MASNAEVYQALRMIGASCRGVGGGDTWATSCAPLWASELKFASRDDVVEAGRRWSRSEDKRPSLSSFLSLVNSIRKQDQRDTGVTGCEECGMSGWREIVVHLKKERGTGREVRAVNAPCTCDRGRHFSISTKGYTVKEAVRDFERNPRLIEMHVTDRHRLVIHMADRMAPEQYQELMKRPKRKIKGWTGVGS